MNVKRLDLNKGNISRLRLIIQLLSFGLLVYGGYLALHIGENVPAFACPYNSESCGTCYLISLQHRSHMEWQDFLGFRGLGFLKGLLIFLGMLIVLSKAWCGFICPLGTIQDWITKARTAVRLRFSRYDRLSFKRLKWIKYVLLVLLIVIPLGMSNSIFGLPLFGEDMSAPFCQVCPGRTVIPLFTGDISQFFIDFSNPVRTVMSTLGILVTGLFFIGAFFKKRFFCFFCPMSALQFLFARIGLLRLVKHGDKCTRCGNCSRVCDVGIEAIADDIDSRFIVKDDCMMCFKCAEHCPEKDALKVKFLGMTLFRSTPEGFFKRTNKNDNIVKP